MLNTSILNYKMKASITISHKHSIVFDNPRYMLMFGGDQIAIANIHQNAANELQLSLYSSFIFSTCMAIRVAQFVEAETTNLVLIMSQVSHSLFSSDNLTKHSSTFISSSAVCN